LEQGWKYANEAKHVLIDMPEKCLRILWSNHRQQIHVMDWINCMKVMKQTVRGWKDIETYARHNQWERAFDVPLAAGGPLEASEPLAAGDKGKHSRRVVCCVSTIYLNVAVAIDIGVVSILLIGIDQGKERNRRNVYANVVTISILLLLCARRRGESCC
jgi:hypothetical protein